MNIFWNIKDNIQDYLYTMKDYSFEKLYSMMKKEIESMGVIDGGDIVKWKTPDKMFEFEIERVGNSFVTTSAYSPQYTNIIKIKNNLGILVTELRFSEYECINILSAISDFCMCHFDNSGESAAIIYPPGNVYIDPIDQIHIHINPNSTIITDKMIHLEFSRSNPKICKFSILEYKMNTMIELLHFVLDYDALVEMCFVIFFQCIIDLDIESICMNGYGDDIYKVEDFVYGAYSYDTFKNQQNYISMQNYQSPVSINENNQIESNSQEEDYIPIKLEPLRMYNKVTKLDIHKRKE